jgi:TatD DNase family protein
MPVWTDAHNHLLDPRLPPAASLSGLLLEAGIDRCVANATSEADWQGLAALATRHAETLLPAFGIHPWKADQATAGWQDRLLEILEKFPQSSVGECGIDRWVHHPPLPLQMPVFVDQLKIARDLDRPLTIHCLKAWGALQDAFSKQNPPRRFLMHSYSGSLEFARELLPLGAYFSFSGHFLHERKKSVVDVFRQLPPDRILLETDAPDMCPPPRFIRHPLPGGLNHPANLPAIGEALAQLLGMPAADLAHLTRANTRHCFDF